MRARALLRETSCEVVDAPHVLERRAGLLRTLDDETDDPTPAGTADETTETDTRRREA